MSLPDPDWLRRRDGEVSSADMPVSLVELLLAHVQRTVREVGDGVRNSPPKSSFSAYFEVDEADLYNRYGAGAGRFGMRGSLSRDIVAWLDRESRASRFGLSVSGVEVWRNETRPTLCVQIRLDVLRVVDFGRVRLSPAEGLADALMDSSSYSVRRPMTFAELADAMAKLNRVGMSSADAANAMSKAMSKIGTAMASAQEGETVPVVLSPGEPEPDSSPVERPRRRFSLAK